MVRVYCNASEIDTLLPEINKGLKSGDSIELKIKKDKNIYFGYFVYAGFKILNLVELGKELIVDISKQKSVDNIKPKKYSWIIGLPRTGKNGKRIYVYKFRTMQPYSEYLQDFVVDVNGLNSDGTIKDDFRITKFGKFLRKYWLDELPMLWNLINGDLKLIGFRPLSDVMLSAYPKEFVKIRNRYKPGLIPPYYIDRPKTFKDIIKSERRYIARYRKCGVLADIEYFFKFLYSFLFKGVRSS